MSARRSKEEKEVLRRRIIEAASRAFYSSGIRNVHMDDLALSLGMSKRTLYEMFHDKEQLLYEVIRFHWSETKDYMADVVLRAENVLAIIFAFYKRKLKEFDSVNPLFFRELAKYPALLDTIREEQQQTETEALRYFKKGVEQGIFRGDIDFRIVNQLISKQFDLLVYSDIIEKYPLSDVYREMTWLHIRGITTLKGVEMVDAFLKETAENNINA